MYAVKYCDATCQRNHWSKHKKDCKRRAAEIHDEALFKDPPAKEDCPICFLPILFLSDDGVVEVVVVIVVVGRRCIGHV